MTWLIIGIALLIVVVVFLFINGADSRKNSDYFRKIEDDEQEKVLSKIRANQNGAKNEAKNKQ